MVRFLYVFFGGVWAVHMAPMELSGGRDDSDTKGCFRFHPPQKKQTNKQSSRFAKEIPFISFHLLAMVTETNDSRNRTCEQVAAIPTFKAPCARLYFLS